MSKLDRWNQSRTSTNIVTKFHCSMNAAFLAGYNFIHSIRTILIRNQIYSTENVLSKLEKLKLQLRSQKMMMNTVSTPFKWTRRIFLKHEIQRHQLCIRLHPIYLHSNILQRREMITKR